MKRFGLLIGFFAVVVFVLPPLPAQDEKKDPAKAEKKDEDKKDEKKDAEKKEPEKKDDEKKKKEDPKKVEKEKLVYGAKFRTRILSSNPESNRDFTIELQEVDPKKVYDLNLWKNQRMGQLTQQQYQASIQKDFKARITQMQNYQRDFANYQIDLAKRQNNIYTAKPLEVRAHETAKARALIPPIEFDDQGFQKKWTKKELEERKDKTGLPGFPVDFDALKSGQFVEIYMAKVLPPPKGPKKKGPADDDPVVMTRQEFVLIVILQDGGK